MRKTKYYEAMDEIKAKKSFKEKMKKVIKEQNVYSKDSFEGGRVKKHYVNRWVWLASAAACFVIIYGIYSFIPAKPIHNAKENESVDIGKNTDDKSELIYLENAIDSIPFPSFDELLKNSDIVVRCNIKEIKGSEMKPYVVEKELIEYYESKGYDKKDYSHIWTNCILNVDEVLYGNYNKNEIDYCYFGGQVENYFQQPFKDLEEGKEYVLFLKKAEDGIYYNASFTQGVLEVDGKKIITKDTIFDDINTVNELKKLLLK